MTSTLTLLYVAVIGALVYISRYCYQWILDTWFYKGGFICYDFFFKNFIQVVSKDNYCMNYGFWETTCKTLMEANMALIHKILEKTDIKGKQGKLILDVGCGYGQQDIEWANVLDNTCKITALDISESQIYSAKKRDSSKDSQITFDIGDAQEINVKFKGKQFDAITSVESAFHYPDRPKFFKAAHSLLSADGTFVICDIMLKPDYVPTFASGLFLQVFSDFLGIPKANLIKPDQWDQDLKDAGFDIIESEDLTEKTFAPYYKHFFNVVPNNISILKPIIEYAVKTIQPFSYRLAVCRPNPIDTSSSSPNLSESHADSVSISISPPVTE